MASDSLQMLTQLRHTVRQLLCCYKVADLPLNVPGRPGAVFEEATNVEIWHASWPVAAAAHF